MDASFILAALVMCAIIGGIIGAGKGQGLAGFFLGGLLGILGIIIIAVSKPKAPVSPPGWHPDPHQRHELRYFDGSSWTAHVSDGGVVTLEP